MAPTPDSHNSSYREVLIEHLFVGEIMRLLWLRGITRFELLKPQVDDSGYDLVLEANGIVRHVQLKSSFRNATTAQVKASLQLLNKPSACVIWICFNPDTLELGPFRWFGGNSGEAIRDISNFGVAKHTRANSKGIKQDRPNQRMIKRSAFERIDSLAGLVTKLFGEFDGRVATP